jgi:outer membrane protein OmpA-like peptidoglycan-associated protein
VVSSSGVAVVDDSVIDLRNPASTGDVYAAPSGARIPAVVPPKDQRGQLLATLLFGNGSSGLGPREFDIVRDVVAIHAAHGGRLGIFGHASRRTRSMPIAQHREVNAKMSLARARSVAQALIDRGVPSSQIDLYPVGDAEPVFFEVMPSGEAGNRRAEIYLVSASG